MLYKQSAIAVAVAVTLVASSLLGGFSVLPAMATHDPDAQQLSERQITQGEEVSVIIDAIGLDAMKATSRTSGTLTVEVIQDGKTLGSGDLDADEIQLISSAVRVELDGAIEVEGDFKIIVEYAGSGLVKANNIQIVEGTEVAEIEDEPTVEETEGDSNPSQSVEEDNVIATRSESQDEDASMIVEEVAFEARKATSRTSGTVIVAIVQENEILAASTIDTDAIMLNYAGVKASFDEEVTGDFDIVIMHDGRGLVQARSISVAGGTTLAEQQPNNPDGTVMLTVNAIDQEGNEVIGMWVEVYEDTTATGEPDFEDDTPVTFELEAGDYVVAMTDFEDTTFLHWQDNDDTDRTRGISLQEDTTLTAVYSTSGETLPSDDEDDTTTTPGEPGTLTVRAFRIPSEHWGPTFEGTAQMWFVIYNSELEYVTGDYFDEGGTLVTDLNEGETYFVSPTDCFECHESSHDVVFDHWEDGSTERQRPVTTGMDVSAYYMYVP